MRVLVVDDEPVARSRLERVLSQMEDVQIVGQAGSAKEALAALEHAKPDLLLLDIDMPGVDGLSLAALPNLPAIVFVTAHSDKALEAFDVGAHDYLVKPVVRERLEAALAKVRERIKLSAEAAPNGQEPWRLMVAEGSLRRFVDAREISCFVAGDKYVSFKWEGRELLLRDSLDALQERLAPYGFLRANRGALVRRDAIDAFDQADGGALVLKDGDRVPVSRRALASIREALGLGAS